MIFRLADCVNVKEIWMCGITPYPGFTEHATNQINKTGVGGSVETVPWRYFDNDLDALSEARRKGLHIVCYEQAEGSKRWPVKFKRRDLLLVFGHEIKGVSDCFKSERMMLSFTVELTWAHVSEPEKLKNQFDDAS